MSKPISERLKKPSYWYADQLPHWTAGMILSGGVSCPLAFGLEWSPAVSAILGIFVSDLIATGRELIQNWGDAPTWGSVEDTTIDAAFWRLGAYLGAIPPLFA